MTLEKELEEAFNSNHVEKITVALLEEKSSKTVVNRLDKLANKELDKNKFKHLTLLLKGIESLCVSNGEDAINSLVSQGLIVKILMWFERATEFLKIEDLKSNTSLANLVEEFYDVALSICKINTEGKRQIQDTFVLRLGVLVTDSDILFCLRLEAVRTLNSILDVTTKEERKKISLSEELALLLVELAKLILNAGDYEMQVAISEALCRMTLKKWREDLVYQWFVNRDFADSFKAINDREFETDCRKFLNKVNSFLGDERRVYTFPCIKAFLEMKELYMPEDPKLEQFWIDFNVGSSCISFFINDPVGTLWDSINLPSENVNSYEIRETDGQKICIIHTGVPVFASNKEGNTVKIIFDSEFDILTAVKKIYGEEKLLKGTSSEKIGPELIDTQDFLSLEEKETTSSPSEAGQGLDGPVDVPDVEKNLYQEVNKTSPVKQNDSFAFEIQSETEVNVPISDALTPTGSNLSHVKKAKRNSFKNVLQRYKVMKAKEKIFSRSFSSERRAKSPKSAENQKERNKRSSRQSHKVQISESDGSSDLSGRSLRLRHKEFLKKVEYSRKKPKSKPRVKVLPLSSASSAEEPNRVVHSTPYASLEQSKENKINEEKTPNVSVEQHMKPQLNGDTENLKISVHENELEDSVFVNVENSTELDSISKKHERTPEARKRKYGISETVRGTEPAQRQALPGEAQSYQSYTGLKPRKLFQQESIAENRAGLSEDSDSGEEGSASVVTAFENFTNELRNKFWSRYRRMSMRSRRSLSDCEKSVSTLFSFVHNCRLNNLERFQKTVMDEIHHLEKDSKSLMDIEKDTVDFWKTQAHTLASFCETQERRLKLLESTNPSTVSLPTEESVPSAAQEKTHPNKSENALLTKSPVKPI